MHRSVSGGWGRGRLTVCPEDRGAQWGGAGGGGREGGLTVYTAQCRGVGGGGD